MKQRKLGPFLAFTLSLELIISPLVPLAHAEDEGGAGTSTSSSTGSSKAQAEEKARTSMMMMNKTLEVVGTVYNSVMQNQAPQMSGQMMGDMAQLTDQQRPQPDKYFNLQKLNQIPGLTNYLALNNINPNLLNCATLKTTLHEARPEVCRIGITDDTGAPPQAQLSNMFQYYNQYFQVSKVYKNYSEVSNSDGQAFGVGCMENAMNILNGFFKYRLDELDKLTTNLEAMQNQFRENSRSDLDAIEEAVAVLDGEGSGFTDKIKTKNPDLLDFKKRLDNPACNSMFAGDKLTTTGKGGLNSIKSVINKEFTTKNGKYSGESYAQSHNAVMNDIDKLADKVAKQFELRFSVISQKPENYSDFLSSLPDSVSSSYGTNKALNASMFSDVQTKFVDSYSKYNDERLTIENELASAGVKGQNATNLLGNLTSGNFDAEVNKIENTIKNNCFSSTLKDIDRERLMSKIYDPSASKHANSHASNFLKDKLDKILDNDNTSLEKKLAELKALESQTSGRYYMKMENSYEVQEVDQSGNLQTRVVGASENRSPAVFFSDLIKNCNAQFKANKLNNKLSGAVAVQKLRQLNNDFKALAKSQAADLKKELKKKMVDCETPEEANNSAPGSCTPERFNTSTAGFCAKAALSCSKFMQSCHKQVEGFVAEIKTQKNLRVKNYKALLEKNKKDMVKIFDSALTRYMQDAEALRGVFGAGFTSPQGIKRELPEEGRYIDAFKNMKGEDGALLLEDPDKYLAMIKGNMKLLRDSVANQQKEIVGGGRSGGVLAAHLENTKRNYQKVSQEADRIASDCRNKHDEAVIAAKNQRNQQMQEHQKRMSELGEKRQEFCNMYGLARTNPRAGCSGVEGDFLKDSMKAVNSNEARNDVARLAEYCGERGYTNSNSAQSSVSADTICAEMPADTTSDSNIQARIRLLCNDLTTKECPKVNTDNGPVETDCKT
ncbi:MAG: hypothetical protein ACLGHN_13150, partial [Bacteriovoracia bacterium]